MSRILILAAFSFVGGCGVTDDAADTEQAVTIENGISLNGISLNGISLNGISLNGISLNGVSVNGTPISIAVTGPPLVGAGLVGSRWTGHVTSGTTVPLRIDAAQQGSGPNSDVWSYEISALVDHRWQPLCRDHTGHPLFADTVRGSWNLGAGVPGGGSYNPRTSDFTIACRGSSIAKCVELGYKPWNGDIRELAACVRALRGDYCGDGTPYTVDGAIVNIYDDDGIQPDGIPWTPEAEWTPDGATCVSTAKATRFSQDAHMTPRCFPHTLKPRRSCGTKFHRGIEIITELPPR